MLQVWLFFHVGTDEHYFCLPDTSVKEPADKDLFERCVLCCWLFPAFAKYFEGGGGKSVSLTLVRRNKDAKPSLLVASEKTRPRER